MAVRLGGMPPQSNPRLMRAIKRERPRNLGQDGTPKRPIGRAAYRSPNRPA